MGEGAKNGEIRGSCSPGACCLGLKPLLMKLFMHIKQSQSASMIGISIEPATKGGSLILI